MIITPSYAALLTIILVMLSVRVIVYRRKINALLGDGSDVQMTQRIRAHGNFVEYAPIGMVMLALTELQGAAPLLVHVLGAALVIGRLSHAVGISLSPQNLFLRQIGMALTLPVLLFMAITMLIRSLSA